MLRARWNEGLLYEAGLDEAGRGALAGPVVAAAVVLPPDYANAAIRDSKRVPPAEREALRLEITEVALCWGVGLAWPREIEEVNILRATFLAMHRALDMLGPCPEHLVVDGNRFVPYVRAGAFIRHTCVVGGDDAHMAVAAASLLAKTFRDDAMRHLAQAEPAYGWARNKGYGTAEHLRALKAHGPCTWHRATFLRAPGLFDETEEAADVAAAG